MTIKLKIFVLVFALAALGISAASAEDASRFPRAERPQFEVFVSALHTDIVGSVVTGERSGTGLGLRGSFHLGGRFALEGSVSKLENSFTFGDVWLADLSAKYYVKNRGRTAVYLVGGPGTMISSDFDAGETLLHLGLGLEILVGDHLFVRPEVRGRWFTDYLRSDATLGDLALGFGWRF